MGIGEDGLKGWQGVISIRKLAALDIAFLGPKLILAEFGGGILLAAAIGLLTLRRSHSVWQILLGAYLLTLAVNYVPLLLYAITIVRHRSAQVEVAHEVTDRNRSFRRYRRQSLLLLVPFAVPILAIAQERQKSSRSGVFP
jgi:hypothetical protein